MRRRSARVIAAVTLLGPTVIAAGLQNPGTAWVGTERGASAQHLLWLREPSLRAIIALTVLRRNKWPASTLSSRGEFRHGDIPKWLACVTWRPTFDGLPALLPLSCELGSGRDRPMTLVHMAVAVNAFGAVVLIFAFLTWRRALALRALVFLTANTLLILVFVDASAAWQVAAMIALGAALLFPQMHSGLQQRRFGKARQGEPVGREPRRLRLSEHHRFRPGNDRTQLQTGRRSSR